jgi:hypothetical protein
MSQFPLQEIIKSKAEKIQRKQRKENNKDKNRHQ